MKTIEGQLNGEGLRIGVIISRFNDFITGRLLEGALDGLRRHGVKDSDIDIVRVPGSFEIPTVAFRLARSDRYHALICLGAVIRGDTPHFEFIAAEVTKGIAQVNMQGRIPVIFGVLTTDTIEQAIERAGTKAGNKGFVAAESAIEMADIFRRIQE